MDFDENDNLDQQGDYVEIYSKNAILWFSVLADPLIGGILLIINLWVVGYKKAILPLVAFLVVFEGLMTAGEYWFVNSYKLSGDKITTIDIIYLAVFKAIQILGAFVLVQFFYKRYFPDNDYYPRSVLMPLFITVLLMMAMQQFGISF